jgi:hypothetical protein
MGNLKSCKPELLSLVNVFGSWVLTLASHLLQLNKADYVFPRAVMMDFLDSGESRRPILDVGWPVKSSTHQLDGEGRPEELSRST